MRKWKMTRLEGGSALRTDSVEGEGAWPVPGQPFRLIGEGLEYGERLVTTSPVESIWPQEEGTHTFNIRTRSGSLYRLEPLDE